MTDTTDEHREGEIWAIAGGKGGTGKTFFTSSAGTWLAQLGRRVILVDMDLGGANLHSFFGIHRPEKSLTGFFEDGLPLAELVTETEFPNMSLITGDIHSLASDAVRFTQKLKLFRQLVKLDVENVLIDLGAGSHYNILDTFLIADRMIVVVVPEVIAIENMYHFVKNTLFRKIKLVLREHGFKEIVQHVWERREEYGIKNLKDLIDHLRESFPYIGTVLDKELAGFRIHLVINMVRNEQDILLGQSIKSVLGKFLGVPILFSGYVEYNDTVWKSVRERRPFMLHYAATAGSRQVGALVQNIMEDRETVLPGESH